MGLDKLQLILFFEGYRSERQLIEQANLNLAHRWYVGYHLDEPLPDHSSLTRIRQRLGLDLFRRFFEHVVELCDQAGLIWGKELLADATKVRANASIDSLVPRLREVVDDHLVELFGEEPPPKQAEPMSETDAPALLHPEKTVSEEPEPADQQRRWDVLAECRLDPDRPSTSAQERLSARKISRTDPDATPISVRYGGSALGYQDHYLVDGGKDRIIPGTRLRVSLITPGDVMENQPFLDQLRRTIFRWQVRPKRVIADTTYATVANIVALDAMGIRAYMPLPDFDERTAYWGRSHFTYEADHDQYRCPQGNSLKRDTAKYTEGLIAYRATAKTCNACPVKAQCTGSQNGRLVHRSLHEDALDRVRRYHQTPAYQKAMRKRQVWVEPLFGEGKQWHGLTQFRLRGLQNVNMEGLVIATGQNLKRYLAARGWGRRQGPCGSLLASFLSPTVPHTGI